VLHGRSDLVEALQQLHQQRSNGSIPEFKRIVIETTGLADPAPILNTLFNDSMVADDYRLDAVVTAVDAVFGLRQIHDQLEARKQAALAAYRGEQLLRVKGIVHAVGELQPFAIHGVQHTLYPTVPLSREQVTGMQTQLVFIVREMEPAFVQQTLDNFIATAE
jgi:G3E family GTPase